MARTKILYVIHNHPTIRPGGAEGYALELYEAFKENAEFEPTLVARVGPNGDARAGAHPGTRLGALNGDPGQYALYTEPSHFDFFWLTSRDKTLYTQDLDRFLRAYRPDVIHFQHTHFIGYDVISKVRSTLPRAPIVYTLHEYLPICHREGQMLRTGSDDLCVSASPRRCHECFPSISPQQFFMRQKLIQAHLAHVDLIVCPSHFLKGRYEAWGLPREKLRYVDQGRFLADPIPAEPRRQRRRIGYFGQMNHFKGIHVLLDAMEILARADVDAHCHLFGANLEVQPESFRRAFAERFGRAGSNLTLAGAYDRTDLPRLMADIDWVVVPSIWWENRPLVIQEAFHHRRPVICSDIGGMAEQVAHEVNGLHFRVGDAHSLAESLARAVGTPGLWDTLRAGIPPVCTMEQHVAELSEIYRDLLAPQRMEVAAAC